MRNDPLDLVTIDKAAPMPIYLQIQHAIAELIDSGTWRPGFKLPSENALVQALNVSRMTVNRALRELTQQHLIRRVHGRGSFVAERPRQASLIELQDIAREVLAAGGSYRAQVLTQESRAANEEQAAFLGLASGDELYLLRVVHFQDEQPMQLESRVVNPAMSPDFINQDFTQLTATAYLLQQFRPQEMEHIVEAILPSAEACQHLQISPAQPCLELLRRTWLQQQIVTRVSLIYPGNRYRLAARYAVTPLATHPQ